jgi:hypothetical protein
LIETAAEVGLHQPGFPPVTTGGHHPPQAGAVQQGTAEISALEAGAAEVGPMPKRALGLGPLSRVKPLGRLASIKLAGERN